MSSDDNPYAFQEYLATLEIASSLQRIEQQRFRPTARRYPRSSDPLTPDEAMAYLASARRRIAAEERRRAAMTKWEKAGPLVVWAMTTVALTLIASLLTRDGVAGTLANIGGDFVSSDLYAGSRLVAMAWTAWYWGMRLLAGLVDDDGDETMDA